jgi:NADH:ubiquinone oxidoreductase subunit 6 (subunit J)
MKFKINTGIFAIETDADSYKLSMSITILVFLLADIFIVLNCQSLGWIQYIIYAIILAIEILFVILIIRGSPAYQAKINKNRVSMIVSAELAQTFHKSYWDNQRKLKKF